MTPATTAGQHFARVTPIVGQGLREARVALAGLPLAAPLVECLAACGVGRWLLASEGGAVARLRARHGDALALDVRELPPAAWAEALRVARPDLVVAVGGPELLALARGAAAAARIPALLVEPPRGGLPCRATVALPEGSPDDEPLPRAPESGPADEGGWSWATSAPLVAGLARALLLRGTPYRRADLEELWASGARVMELGGAHPFDVGWGDGAGRCGERRSPSPAPALPFTTPRVRRGALLVAGLGSIGSVAATHLVDHAAALVLADPERVDAFNPARQAYDLADIGRPKAEALAGALRRLGATRVVALPEALADEGRVAELIEAHGITAALVATGGGADFAIARALREAGVPHIVGRCYPRARYWEAIVVDGGRGPALADMRGHLQLGPAPAPTPEQVAAYSDAGALEAEPATLVESGWAAAWMARLAAQLLAPPGLRERWMLELLESGRTCLVGGVGVEPTPGGPAYGVALPGQIHAWGRAQIARR